MIMGWKSVAKGIGRCMMFVANARQLRDGRSAPHGRRDGGAAAILALLLLAPAAYAGESPQSFFAGGLTEQSSWEQILKTRGVRAEFPHVGFGTMFVPLQSLCLDGDMLAVSDPRIDNGHRISADSIGSRRWTEAGAAARAAAPGRTGSDVAPGASDRPTPPPVIYPVAVVRIIETGLSPQRILLFRKDWQVPPCTGR
jgi:hypothetical protein